MLGGHLLASALVGLDDSTVSNTQLFDLPIRGRMMMAAPRLEMGWRLAPWMDLVVGGDAAALQHRDPQRGEVAGIHALEADVHDLVEARRFQPLAV